MDKSKIWKMVIILAAIVVLASSLSKIFSLNSLSLTEYIALNTDPDTSSEDGEPEQSPGLTDDSESTDDTDQTDSSDPALSDNGTDPSSDPENGGDASPLTGAALNGSSCLEQRISLADGFYYEPLSDKLRRYITGISFPTLEETYAPDGTESPGHEDSADGAEIVPLAITLDDLSYVHILHYGFDGNPMEGELICNSYIAQDLVEIFHELYRNEYKLERVLLVDEYNGDAVASMEGNNTYCFCYSPENGNHASRHAQGLAVDVNPLYNPYIAYTLDGTENITPAASSAYADRSINFPYKIDEDDLCYRLFTQHGFTWGGHWNDAKGFQHFQKTID